MGEPEPTITDRKHEMDAAFSMLRAFLEDNVSSAAAREIGKHLLIDLALATADYTAALYVHAAQSKIDPAKIAALIDRPDGTWGQVIAASPAVEANPPPRVMPRCATIGPTGLFCELDHGHDGAHVTRGLLFDAEVGELFDLAGEG